MVMFFMPLLYTGMLLYAFWDPYHHLENLPVALVNEDTGAVLDGEGIHLGDELIETLIDEQVFKFVEVDKVDAERLLEEQEYYMLIRIPENFSQHATTLLDESPSKLEIEYIANEGYNFISAQIGSNAVQQIRNEVNNTVATTYATQLYDSITQLGEGFTDAADAASALQDGASQVADGTEEIKNYLYQLASSTVELSEGANSLNDGISKATEGAVSLENGTNELLQGTKQLQQGVQSAADGATSLQQGITQYTAGVDSLAEGQTSLITGQQQLEEGVAKVAQNVEALSDGAGELSTGAASVSQGISALATQLESMMANMPAEQAAQLKATLKQLEDGSAAVQQGTTSLATNAEQLAQGAATLEQSGGELVTGQQQVAQGITQLQQNSTSLQQGADSLQQGNVTLAEKLAELEKGTTSLAQGAGDLRAGLVDAAAGTTKINDGTSQLARKSGELADGSQTLAEGSTKLLDGTGELVSGLSEAGDEAEISISDDNIDMTINPVDLNKTVINEVDNYGTGLAPYFISLGLFVGALLLTNVYPLVQPAGHPTGAVSWFMSKSSIVIIVGIFQVLFTLLILHFGLGLQVDNFALLVLTVEVTSFTFLAIVQVFTVVLGDVGRFLALIFLIIQLAGSAGTFPLELLPGPLQAVHNYLPMTYSVNAFRAVISSNDYGTLAQCLAVLSVVGVICVAISFGFFTLLYKRRYSKTVAAEQA